MKLELFGKHTITIEHDVSIKCAKCNTTLEVVDAKGYSDEVIYFVALCPKCCPRDTFAETAEEIMGEREELMWQLADSTADKYVPCDVCKGTGQITRYAEGSSTSIHTIITCPACKGSKYIVAPADGVVIASDTGKPGYGKYRKETK